MKKNKQLVPKRRFKEFENSEEWNQEVLGNVLSLLKDGTHGTHPNAAEGAYLLSAKNIKNGNVEINPETDRIISEKEYKKIHSTFKLEKNDVLLTVVGSIGESAILEDSTNITFQRSVAYLRPNDRIRSYFLFIAVNTARFQQELKNRQVVSAQPGIYLNMLEITPIQYPKIDEQMQIGLFFKKVNRLILIQQNRLKKTKKIKSAYLSDMFPEEGKEYPKKRFEGFSESWDKANLDKVARVRTGYPFNSNDFDESGEYLVITNGNIQDNLSIVDNSSGNRITPKDNTVIEEYLLHKKDILVTMDGTVGRTAKVLESNQILAQRVGRLTANINPEFLYQSLQTGDFFKKMTLISHGGTIKHISLSEIGSYELMVPSDAEQIKIGNFFKNLDVQIALEEQKLKKLEQLKQAYLNELFV